MSVVFLIITNPPMSSEDLDCTAKLKVEAISTLETSALPAYFTTAMIVGPHFPP